ncbi:hypothetical protein [Halosimplex pelagicum]|uniref:Uncharacterized protein n=1 Tax=Halosimplex pelagicum TaxID=869886 RepID=A0A7D5P9P1_9EURY|nr:hypothetical protein [Halosimplex pelagicum]QLH82284.1 hypothetical protein HZS54_11965 [Halosimplex pelagicum]
MKQRVIALDYADNPNTELVHQLIKHGKGGSADPSFETEFILTVSPHTPPRGKTERFPEGDTITLSEWLTRPYGNPDKKVAHEVRLNVLGSETGYATVAVERRRADPERPSPNAEWRVDSEFTVVEEYQFSVGSRKPEPASQPAEQQHTDGREGNPENVGVEADLEAKMPDSLQ